MERHPCQNTATVWTVLGRLGSRQEQDADSFGNTNRLAFFGGDQEAMQEGCTTWADCPKGWIHQLPFETPESTNDVHQIDCILFKKDQPIFVEWALTNGHWSDTWTDIAASTC